MADDLDSSSTRLIEEMISLAVEINWVLRKLSKGSALSYTDVRSSLGQFVDDLMLTYQAEKIVEQGGPLAKPYFEREWLPRHMEIIVRHAQAIEGQDASLIPRSNPFSRLRDRGLLLASRRPLDNSNPAIFCRGLTKLGRSCRRKSTRLRDGLRGDYCYQHAPQGERDAADPVADYIAAEVPKVEQVVIQRWLAKTPLPSP
jgi:hypothetical protein